VNRLVGGLVALVLGAVAFGVIAPSLAKLASALTGPIVAGGVVACLVRIVWVATRRW
jgi:hypothetical protein